MNYPEPCVAERRWVQARPDLCRDCQACVLGCSLLHEAECRPSLARLVVSKDMARYEFDISVCRHCQEPACLEACPAGAIQMDERGVAVLLDEACIRCSACAEACPYSAISHSEAEDRYLKCDLCAGREAGPLCVELCPVGALTLAAEGPGAES